MTEHSGTINFAQEKANLMQPLEPISFPLTGTSLIEASAGTGKTYTIVNLYLRLLLGVGCQPLDVTQILVVTFTNAATAELKDRIRQRLRDAYLAFFAGYSSDDFTQTLIEQSADLDIDCQRLALATKQMDEASIFTIHGFCQRALTEHAFESGAMYEQSFILDESHWLQMAAEDFWRKRIVSLDLRVLSFVLSQWSSPNDLLTNLRGLLNKKVVQPKPVDIQSAIDAIHHYAQDVNRAKSWWLKEQVLEQLSQAKLKASTKLGKLENLRKMQCFSQSDELNIDFDKDGWNAFSSEKVSKALSKNSPDISHLDFSRFDELDRQYNNCQNLVKNAFSQTALSEISANLVTNKQRLQLLSPDDQLSGLHTALYGSLQKQNAANADNISILAKTLRTKYPAALIDEFQDTDPIQFEIFKGIYEPEPYARQVNKQGETTDKDNSCWIMIGDPKQAIYAFRGADIFTYIQAKQWVDSSRHFTLTTNWRSTPKLDPLSNKLNRTVEK